VVYVSASYIKKGLKCAWILLGLGIDLLNTERLLWDAGRLNGRMDIRRPCINTIYSNECIYLRSKWRDTRLFRCLFFMGPLEVMMRVCFSKMLNCVPSKVNQSNGDNRIPKESNRDK
jgi:hypothetical protein